MKCLFCFTTHEAFPATIMSSDDSIIEQVCLKIGYQHTHLIGYEGIQRDREVDSQCVPEIVVELLQVRGLSRQVNLGAHKEPNESEGHHLVVALMFPLASRHTAISDKIARVVYPAVKNEAKPRWGHAGNQMEV
eukprot:784839-Pelagomonas_calceolata.AAC.3